MIRWTFYFFAFQLASMALQIPLGPLFTKAPHAPTDEWIDGLLNKLTPAELALQLDMFAGDSLVRNGKMLSDVYYKDLFGQGTIPGTLHDFYAPVESVNRIQEYAITKTRHKIPILIIEECLHGLLYSNRTVFPQAIALAATFNTALVEKVGRAIGREARASGVHFCLSPVLDLARDPRWGRVEEGYGECPFLTSQMAVAMVLGMQNRGNLNSSSAVVAEMKHFAAHGSPYGGRNTAPVKDGRREVFSSYLVPFREAVVTAGARGVMAAYNEVDGIPNAANHELLTEVLRETWGFKGIVVADLGAISMLKHSHFVAIDSSDAIRQFHEAGGNVQFYDYSHDVYVSNIVERIETDTKYLETIRTRVRELLKLKNELGLFENPYVDSKFTEDNVNQPETQELGLEASRESVVLLRNEDNLLPIDPSRVRRIAVIGPNAAFLQTGDYSPNSHNYYRTTILEGIHHHARKHQIQIKHVPGCDVDQFELREIAQGYLSDGNGNLGLLGRYYDGDFDGKPVFSRTDAEIGMSWFTWPPRHGVVNLTDADSFSVEWTGFLTPDTTVDGFLGFDSVNSKSRATLYVDDEVFSPAQSEDVFVFSSKRNFTKPRLFKEQKPISSFDLPKDYKEKRMFIAGSTYFFPMRFESGKTKKIRIVYHNIGSRGGARLIWNTVGSEGIHDALNAASEADLAIVVVGDNSFVMGEGRDRSSLELAGKQSDLIQKLFSSGTPMVLVLSNGRPPVIPWESKNVPAIIEAFYGGQSGGQAVADVLFGSYNPSGRLPISFARSAGALPSFYNGPPTFFQNGYLDSDATPVYPFGYGLSYTQFVYENFDVFPKTISRKDEKASLTFSFVVRNVGASDGDEVPQLYRLGHVSSVTLPYKQLVGLTRIHIPQGSSKEVLMVLPVHKWLSVWNRTMDWDLETGSREFVIGPDSQREWGNVTVHIAS